MLMRNTGVISMGIKTPIIREGDDLAKIVVNSVLNATLKDSKFIDVPDETTKSGWRVEEVKSYNINDKDVIGITESVVARSLGNYVTVDDIGLDLQLKFGSNVNYVIVNPIYSRNRFSMILKAIARASNNLVVIYMPDADEVGNPSGVNQFTGVNMKEYYTELVNKENRKCVIVEHSLGDNSEEEKQYTIPNAVYIYCGLHDYEQWKEDYGDDTHITLADICKNRCDYGLLGSNKATEEKLKLFPTKQTSQVLVEKVQQMILDKTGKKVEVMVYGDGCFKDPVGGIWEFADPVVSPAFTSGLVGTPNEIKIKAFADDKFSNLNGDELTSALKNEIKLKDSNLVGNMAAEGTTPRRFTDLLGSLMDLTSGSGDKGTPVVLVQHYFENYSMD